MAKKPKKTTAATPQVDARIFSRASARANERANAGEKTMGYYYGNLGDVAERRLPGGGGLGGGSDLGNYWGSNSTYPAVGNGNYYGAGIGMGPGSRLHSIFDSNGGGGGGFQYLNKLSGQSAFNHQIIASCLMAYFGHGVVKNVVDSCADFAAEGFEIVHPQQSVRNFYNTWARKVNLNERVNNIFWTFFATQNVFIHRRWATLSPKEKSSMKRAEGEVINGEILIRGKRKDTPVIGKEVGVLGRFLESQTIVKSKAAFEDSPFEENLPDDIDNKIPWGYTCLNPLQMEARGKKLRGAGYWAIALNKEDTKVLKEEELRGSRTQEMGSTETNIPKEFKSRLRPYEGKGSLYTSEVKLGSEDLTVIQGRKPDWFDWSVPFVFPALRAISYKDCLRNMESKACESIINSVFLWKIGNQKDGFPAEEEHFERLADMLQLPGQALNILWNENIEAEVLQPNIAGIFDSKKHESADRDILTALGIPEVLVGGKGGNFSNSYISVATVLERLETARELVRTWLMGEFKLIADVMGFQKLPDVKFGRTSLSDRKAEQSFMTGLFDRGVLSADDLLRFNDTTFEVQVEKQKEEERIRKEDKNVQKIRGPFVKDPKPEVGAGPKGVGPKGVAPKPKGQNGRPAGSDTGPTGKQDNPRKPKGQGLAEVFEMYDQYETAGKQLLSGVEEFCNAGLLRARADEGLQYIKQLQRDDRDRLEQLIYNVFSNIPAKESHNFENDDFMTHILSSDATVGVKSDILSIYTGKVSGYSSQYGKNPSREMRRKFMVSAWTQYAISEHMQGINGVLEY
jgi:hypothetical protein